MISEGENATKEPVVYAPRTHRHDRVCAECDGRGWIWSRSYAICSECDGHGFYRGGRAKISGPAVSHQQSSSLADTL